MLPGARLAAFLLMLGNDPDTVLRVVMLAHVLDEDAARAALEQAMDSAARRPVSPWRDRR